MNNNIKQRVIWHGIPLGITACILSVATPALATLDSRDCQTIINQALQTMQDKCRDINRNSACFGNDQISTQFADSLAVPQFKLVGDVVSIKQIKSLSTSPLNQQDNTWGVALLKIQANLPDTLPGQNVTFLVYGDTSVQNTSGDMRVFYFSSGLGVPTCTEVPQEGIVVQSPNHMQVNFNANGVHIQIASTILLHAEANKTLDVTLLEGHAIVSTAEGTETLLPGQIVSVPIGGATGLEATGAPSIPVSIDPSTVARLARYVQALRSVSNLSTPAPSKTVIPTKEADSNSDSSGPHNNPGKGKDGKGDGDGNGDGGGKNH